MPDPYAMIAEADPAVQERIAGVLETRGADPQQQPMRRAFLDSIPFPAGARVLDVGCGTGVLTRELARLPSVGEVVGVDPSPVLLGRARELAADLPRVAFREADGRDLPFADASFDAVVIYTTLCHVPGPERVVAEAYRVLRPGGCLAVLDGDYMTSTVALGDHDPLQACVDILMANWVHNRSLVRDLPALVRACGFEATCPRSHGYLDTTADGYMMTVVDRGADLLASAGRIGPDTAAALKAEARRRAEAGTFFGHIAYGSLVARKPA